MRPRIIDVLNAGLGSETLSFFVPNGVFVYALAIIVVTWVFVRRCDAAGLSAYHALGASILAMLGGLLGTRIFYLLLNLRYTILHPEVIFDLSGGNVSWGAYIGGSAGFILYLGRNGLPILSYADVLGASLGLGPFLARWSCFLNGCCYGTVSTLPWAIQYPAGSYAHSAHLHMGLIGSNATLSLPVHPVQIYLSLAGLMIFFLATRFWFRFKHITGTTFAFYWLMYGMLRFVIEFFRADYPGPKLLQLTLAQCICVIVVTLALSYLLVRFFLFHKMNGVVKLSLENNQTECK